MIDIEKVADSIKPKSTVTKISAESSLSKEGEGDVSGVSVEPQIFKARDIKDLNDRKSYLLKLIAEQKEYATTDIYTKPLVKGFTINGKWHPVEQKDIKVEPDQQLISHCENELRLTEDLLFIGKIVNEYCKIQGENERRYYLFHAKEGQAKMCIDGQHTTQKMSFPK
ncbi:hypothetical protein [Paraflavitalea speifideaquila]|uniref:hypothetical protein n=1 Tax=Paraflavitalea speifideaquila TaxID=3076558 RepID=UPI0028E3370C|nr:hypothetical protein [Paraflavitalea speifideiaquila]